MNSIMFAVNVFQEIEIAYGQEILGLMIEKNGLERNLLLIETLAVVFFVSFA